MKRGRSGDGSSKRDASQVVADRASASSPTMTAKAGQLASQNKGPVSKKKTASHPRCKVEGCGVDVSSQKEQNKRYRICDFHVKSEFVKWEGKIHRFCQQCSRMQLLNEFDGQKRSCRESLEKIGFKRRTKSMDTQASSSLVTGVQTPPSLKRRVTHQLSPAVTPSSGMSKLAVSRPAVVAAAVIPRASSLPEQHSASSSGTRLNNGNAGGAASAAAATAAGGAAASAGAAGPAQNAAVALMAHQGQSSSPSPSPRTPLQPLQPLILKVPDNAAILRNHLEQSADEAFLSPTNLELNGRSQHTLFSLLPQPVEENGTPQTPSPKSSPAPQWTVSEQQSATKASRRPQSPAVAAGAQRTRIFSNLSQPSFQQSSLGSPAPPEAPTTQPMVMLHETPMSKMTVLSGRQLSGRSFKITGANTSPVASPTSSNPFSQGPAASAAPPQAPVLHHQSPQPSGLLGPSFPSVPEQQPIQALAAAAAAAAPAPQMSWQEAVALATAIYQQRPQQGQQGDGAVVASPGGSAAPMGSLQALGAFAETQMMAQQQQQQQPQQQQQQYQQQYQPQQQQQQYQPQQQQQQQQYQPQQQQQLQQQQHQQQQQQQQQQYQLRQQQQQQQLQYQLQFQQQQQPQQQQQQQQQGMAPLQAATPMGSLQTLGDFARASGGSQGNTALLVSAAARELPPKQISAIGSVITQAMQGGTLLQQQQQHLQQSPHSAAVTAAVAAASSATPPWPVATVGEQQMQQAVPPLDLMRHPAPYPYPEPSFLSPRQSGDLESMMAMCNSPTDALLAVEKPSWPSWA